MLEYFKKLTKEELLSFEKFIYSPYFNSQKTLMKLFEYLRENYPRIEDDLISKKNLSLKIYGEKNINDIKIRKLISDFSILMEKFLTQLEIEKRSTENKILLLSSMRKRGIRRRFEMNMNELIKLQKNTYSKDSDFYLNQANLLSEYYYFNFGDIRSDFTGSLQDKSDNLDFYFIFSKLHNFHEMLHNEGSKNKNVFYKKIFFNEIRSYIEENRKIIFEKHPNIFIIYIVLMMFDTLDDKYLYELLSYLKSNETKFTKDNLNYYYQYASQYYIQKVNNGMTEYRKNIFEIFEIMREKKLFLIDNIITDLEFNSVVNISLSVKKFKWLDEFIEEYKDYIDPDFSKDSYNLAKSKLHFHRKEYQKVFNYLNDVEIKDSNYYMNSKFLLSKVYYEMKNFVGAKYIIENLKQYIRVKKTLPPEQSKVIQLFRNYMNELIKVKESSSKDRKSLKRILQKELEFEKGLVPTKDWFFEKLDEM